MRRRAVTAAITVLALLMLGAPATAHPVSHAAGPRIVNVRPAPGEVLAAGARTVAGLAIADRDVVAHRLVVDGQEVSSTRESGTHPTVAASVDVAPGTHVAQLQVTDAAGRQAQRSWRFAVSGLGVDRLAGAGRMETAVRISRDLYPTAGSAQAAVLARADDFPDALAGGPLAEAVDAPLLLTRSDALRPPAAEELQRVLPAGATVYLLGGQRALSSQVARDVQQLGFTVQRLAGDGRYATAVEVAEQLPESRTAVVVSGRSFADALAASSPAARQGWPILLTGPDALPSETESHLRAGGFSEVIVVGGSAAVSDDVAERLRTVVGEVSRLAGASRYHTAARVGAHFFPDAEEVAVASGRDFPDALAGGRHAARLQAPLLLTSNRLPPPQHAQVGDVRPERAVVYGGPAAVGDRTVGDLRRADASAGAAPLTGVQPRDGARVHTLDEVVLSFERDVVLEHSDVSVQIGAHEVPGRVRHGEFDNTLVFTPSELPGGARDGNVHEVRVTAMAYDGQRWRHVEHRLTYHKIDLARGDTGSAVRDLQERLSANGYWLGRVDGIYDTLTHQAVTAFQKVHGLNPDGTYDLATRRKLESNPPRPSVRTTSGRWIEIDLRRQVLIAVANGRVEWVFNTSTGHGRVYEFEGSTYRATTSTGQRRVTREINGLREAARGSLWRPKYFDASRGIAIHGSTSVPAYPASAGCVRVTYPAMDFIWESGLAPVGTGVWVYPENHYG